MSFWICHLTFAFRIGHENFELINHDVVEPLYIQGMYFDFPFWVFSGVFMKAKYGWQETLACFLFI